MNEADQLKCSYIELVDQLLNCERRLTLEEGMEKRYQLQERYDAIHEISTKIQALSLDNGREPSETNLCVHDNIYQYATTYLEANQGTIPDLPSRKKLEEIETKREREILRQREEEKKSLEEPATSKAAKKKAAATKKTPTEAPFLSMLRRKRLKEPAASKAAKKKAAATKKTSTEAPSLSMSGWTVTPSCTDSASDPFEVQRQQLQSFIKQAKEDKRHDDILALEESLRKIEAVWVKRPCKTRP